MTTQPSPAVVAGVDGSRASSLAVDLAADEAVRHQLPLRLVCGLLWPVYTPALATPDGPASPAATPWNGAHPGGAQPGSVNPGDALGDAHRMLDAEAGRVRQRHPSLDITTQVIAGGPAGVLRAESERAAMVVVGHRGRGGFTGLFTGSVATQLCAHAHCPVIVVRPELVQPAAASAGPVVVGIDGSEASTLAAEFAFEMAAHRKAPLTAVTVWREPPISSDEVFQPVAYGYDQAFRAATRELAESLADLEKQYPTVPVTQTLVHGQGTARRLLDLTDGAALMVVGSRGHGGFSGLLLGSVSQALINHAKCPVAVVRRATARV